MGLSYFYLAAQFIFYLFHLSVLILLIFKRKTTFKGPFYVIFKIVLFVDLINFFYVSFLQNFKRQSLARKVRQEIVEKSSIHNVS